MVWRGDVSVEERDDVRKLDVRDNVRKLVVTESRGADVKGRNMT